MYRASAPPLKGNPRSRFSMNRFISYLSLAREKKLCDYRIKFSYENTPRNDREVKLQRGLILSGSSVRARRMCKKSKNIRYLRYRVARNATQTTRLKNLRIQQRFSISTIRENVQKFNGPDLRDV